MGALPFVYLISEPALKAVCTMLLENPLPVGDRIALRHRGQPRRLSSVRFQFAERPDFVDRLENNAACGRPSLIR